MILEGGNYGCYDDFCIEIVDADGNIHSNFFDITDADQTFEVSIIDCQGNGNSCWGEVTVEYKLTPEIECPADTMVMCNEEMDPSLLGAPFALTCVPGTLASTYEDIVELENCETGVAAIVTRIWTVSYEGGTQTCVQTITIESFDVMEVDFPDHYFGEQALSCSDVANNPDLTSPEYLGEPNINGQSLFGDHYCEINVGFWDEMLYDVNCPGAYEILRNWIVRDECAPLVDGINPLRHIQSIKVEDFTAPVIEDIADVTISTDLWGCGASFNLENILVTDNCASYDEIDVNISVQGGAVFDNTIILYEPATDKTFDITIKATDLCKNSSFQSFTFTVVDNILPVIVAETSTTVSLSDDGIAKAFAEDFDDGSHDGCGPIVFLVKRVDDGGNCLSLDKFGDGLNLDPNNVDDNKEFNELVHFCCSDVGTPIMVEFMVCDDGNGDGIAGNSGDNCNTAMVEVEVQDKLAPEIICPDDMTISCIDLAGIGNLQDLSDDFLNEQFGFANAAATCNVTISQNIVGSEVCGEGIIIRTFTATNSIGETSTCSQFITVEAGPNELLSCNRISFADLNNNIYNWCSTTVNYPVIEIDCDDGLEIPELDIDINGLCTQVGLNITVDTFQFAGGACQKYLIHYEVIDQCLFDENYVDPATGEIDPYHSENGYFEFYLEVDAFDSRPPEVTCDDITVTSQSCDGWDGVITPSVTDNCTAPEFLSYLFRLDLEADNSIDLPADGSYIEGNSVQPSAFGLT